MAKKNKNNEALDSKATLSQDAMGKYGVKSESKTIRKREALIRVLTIILVLLLMFLSVMFACSSYVNKAGDFTVTMDKDAFNAGITLCETKDFTISSRFLAGEKCENMADCTLEWLPDDIDNIDGSHNRSNGAEFLAYTFYVKNAGEKDVKYSARILIESVSLGVDEAARVMVFKNGTPTIYAKPKKGTTNMFETNNGTYDIDKLFVSSTKIMEETTEEFKVGDIDKYTVVVWLEGWDQECVDDILGGDIKMAMDFNCEVLATGDGAAA